MARVFISYQTQDRARTVHLERALRINGFDVWWDRNLTVGSAFGAAIQSEIEKSDALLILWSEDSMKSQYVLDEVAYALELRKRVAPVSFVPGLKPPRDFAHLQVQNLSAWDGEDADHPAVLSVCDYLRSGAALRVSESRVGGDLVGPLAAPIMGVPAQRWISGIVLLTALLSSLQWWAALRGGAGAPWVGVAVIAPFVLGFARAIHQWIIKSRGYMTRNFFDVEFQTWLLLAALCAPLLSLATQGIVLRVEHLLADFPLRFLIALLSLSTLRAIGQLAKRFQS